MLLLLQNCCKCRILKYVECLICKNNAEDENDFGLEATDYWITHIKKMLHFIKAIYSLPLSVSFLSFARTHTLTHTVHAGNSHTVLEGDHVGVSRLFQV